MKMSTPIWNIKTRPVKINPSRPRSLWNSIRDRDRDDPAGHYFGAAWGKDFEDWAEFDDQTEGEAFSIAATISDAGYPFGRDGSNWIQSNSPAQCTECKQLSSSHPKRIAVLSLLRTNWLNETKVSLQIDDQEENDKKSDKFLAELRINRFDLKDISLDSSIGVSRFDLSNRAELLDCSSHLHTVRYSWRQW